MFIALALVMLGNGLLGTQVALRAELADFSTSVTGVVMAAYFAGFLFGALGIPRFVLRVGHIRVFAAMASLASVAALLFALWVDPWAWAFMRLLTGVAMSGLYIVTESWLNDLAENATRGRLLSAYMVVSMGGFAAGQLLLNVADPQSFELFVLASVLVSLAVIPVTMSASAAPHFGVSGSLSLREVWRRAPLGIAGGFSQGITGGALLALGAVFATRSGMPVDRIAVFMSLAIAGSVVLQWPIGAMSDRLNRRSAILLVSLGAAVAAIGAVSVDPGGGSLLLIVFVLGGFVYPLYSLNLSHINDNLPQGSAVAASSLYLAVNGSGAVLGPIAGALAIEAFGPEGLFWMIGAVQSLVVVFAGIRLVVRRTIPSERHRRFAMVPARSSPIVAQMAVHRDRGVQDDPGPGSPQ